MNTDRITAPVGEFCRLAGIGRTLCYAMLADGRLASILIGKRRLVVLDSFRQLIERQCTEGYEPSPDRSTILDRPPTPEGQRAGSLPLRRS